MHWQAKAIGEKSAAAEAKLETYGPFDKMSVRRTITVVLEVLKEILEDEFSVDRLEMVCVDLGTGEAGCREFTPLSKENGGKINSKRLEKKQSIATMLSAENMAGTVDVRGRKGGVEEVERRNSGDDAESMRGHRHSFRRVPRSELDELLRGGVRRSTEL